MNSKEITPSQSDSQSHGLLVGLRAARANLVPGLIVQAAMLVLVLGYYFNPSIREALAHLADLKGRCGYLFSFVAGAVAGGFLPEVLSVVVFNRGRIRRENFGNLVFGVLFWGVQGMIVDAFYRGQAWMFGTQISFQTVGVKVLVDQFVYNPFFAAPFGLMAYEWKNQHYRFTGDVAGVDGPLLQGAHRACAGGDLGGVDSGGQLGLCLAVAAADPAIQPCSYFLGDDLYLD